MGVQYYYLSHIVSGVYSTNLSDCPRYSIGYCTYDMSILPRLQNGNPQLIMSLTVAAYATVSIILLE